MRPPEFWATDNALARLLDPIGRIVGAITSQRAGGSSVYRPDAPVVSVGNVTVGGTGKTPVTLAIARRLRAAGAAPAVLLRGYGGRMRGPVRVDPVVHTALDVGDEALLHAAAGPTWVARRRAAAAAAAVKAGANALLLDDGHQHPGIAKDLALLVVDGRTGLGNGRVAPAGPLRESVVEALARAHAVILMGADGHGLRRRLGQHRPVLQAQLVPGPEAARLKGQRVVAFAGIGDPTKFWQTLADLGAQVVATHAFDDHQAYGEADIQPILDEAFALGAVPVTTAKDAVRLAPDQRQQVDVLSVDVRWDDPRALDDLLAKGTGLTL